MLAPVDAGAVAPEPYAPALADYPAALPEYPAALPDYPAALPEYPAALPDYPGALLEYPAALPEYPAALPAYDVALPGDYAPAPVEIPGSHRQIVPHVLIKFVPPGTLTAPAGCAPVALPPPPAAPLPAGPAYVPYDQFEPEQDAEVAQVNDWRAFRGAITPPRAPHHLRGAITPPAVARSPLRLDASPDSVTAWPAELAQRVGKLEERLGVADLEDEQFGAGPREEPTPTPVSFPPKRGRTPQGATPTSVETARDERPMEKLFRYDEKPFRYDEKPFRYDEKPFGGFRYEEKPFRYDEKPLRYDEKPRPPQRPASRKGKQAKMTATYGGRPQRVWTGLSTVCRPISAAKSPSPHRGPVNTGALLFA